MGIGPNVDIDNEKCFWIYLPPTDANINIKEEKLIWTGYIDERLYIQLQSFKARFATKNIYFFLIV
jgi:hypothetical protein